MSLDKLSGRATVALPYNKLRRRQSWPQYW